MSCGCGGGRALRPSLAVPSVSRDAAGGWSKECTALGAALAMSGAAVGTYHGYKRNNSVGWAVAWGAFGAIFPVLAIPLAIAQGLGKPADSLQPTVPSLDKKEEQT